MSSDNSNDNIDENSEILENADVKKNLNNLINNIKNVWLEYFFNLDDIKNQTFLIDGDGPYLHDDIERLILGLGVSSISDNRQLNEIDLYILGRRGYDRSLLQKAMKFNNIRFFTQEDLLDLILFRNDTEYVDTNLPNHPGFNYLTSLGYSWNKKDPETSDGERQLQMESDLHKKYGYNVQKYTPVWKRRESLNNAVKGIGLKKVANYIAFFIRMNTRRKDDLLSKAVSKWIDDLDWLKESYYKKYKYNFDWPKIK
jgi:hypothetical protein